MSISTCLSVKNVVAVSRWMVGIVLSASLVGFVPAWGAIIQVAPGVVNANSSTCSLIDAINAANSNQPTGACPAGNDHTNGGDTIQLGAGVYTLSQPDNSWYGSNGLPPIASNITIVGDATGSTIERSSAAGTAPFRLFYIGGGQPLGGYNPPSGLATLPGPGSLTLKRLTLKNGLAQGGAGLGGAGGGMGAGGAIYNQGQLVLVGDTFLGNQALGGGAKSGSNASGGGMGGVDDGHGHGGGVLYPSGLWSPGGLATNYGQFGNGGSHGSDTNNGNGGAGTHGGVGGGGGAGGHGGYANNGDDGGNGGNGGFGGGGGDGGNSGYGPSFGGYGGDGGKGGFGGGGGAGGSGDLGNGTNGASGFGAGNCGGGAGMGGAVFNEGGTVSVVNTTFTANRAAGGSTSCDAGGDGYGGAVFNLNGSVTLRYTTLADNVVAGGAKGSVSSSVPGDAVGGAVYNLYLASPGSPAADAGTAATVTISSSILSDSPTGVSDCDNQGGSVTSGYNVIETTGGCTPGANDQAGDPHLGALADNGGATMTMALPKGSLAVDHGDANDSNVLDQRGLVRDAQPDAGAFEYNAVPLVIGITGLDDVAVYVGDAVPARAFKLTDTASGTLTVTLASSNTALLAAGGMSANSGCGSDANHYDCSLSLAPTAGLYGSSTITVTATDTHGTQASASFVLTVKPIPPVAGSLALTTFAGTAIGGVLPAADVYGHTLSYAVKTQPAHGTVSNFDGAFTYTPADGFTGTDNFTFTATDTVTKAVSTPATVSINVQAVPGASGGGGGFGWLGLALLAPAFGRRRRYRQSKGSITL